MTWHRSLIPFYLVLDLILVASQTIVGINIWVAHRSQKVFGEDADVFRPERWLEAGEKLSLMNKYFLPVSAIAR
jgi:cytochrome P450